MQAVVEFPGGVFSQQLEGGRAGATVSLSAGAVVAVTPEGDLFRVPFSDCELERGGASDKMWFCRTKDRALTIFTEAPGFVGALSVAAKRDLGPRIEALLNTQQAEARRRLYVWLAALGVLTVLVWGGYLGLRRAGRASIGMLPPSIDRQLGDLALENMTLGGPVKDDPVLKGGVDEIVKRLSQGDKSGFKFRVQVVDADIVNAFALPGGAIVVYTGLLRAARGPEEVAGVLAHELAHVTRRHGMQRVAQSVGVIACIQLLLGDVSGIAAVAVEILRDGAINSYSRDDEHQADMDAVKTLSRSSVDPNALADFFAVLEKKEAGSLQLPAFMATHPDLAKRILDVRTEAKRTRFTQAKPFALSWAEVQKHAGLSP